MAVMRTKSNINNELFHQRFTELSDEVRAKNKREDRLLEIRLKYHEREKNIRLNILRKEQYHLECTRSTLIDQVNRIQLERYRKFMPSYLPEKNKLEMPPLVQLSTPEFFNTDWEPVSNPIPVVAKETSITPTNLVRPHSAG
ncbi:unnamed protein product [Adineta ricciae]|uniref:Uncharacterized protein n=1 Tax=Adineta ricciae TaxID=249248 RepID=A0A815VF73_ADIRI|nr:unnamed protein product [Adineta ricciae]CAF1534260.1 unnamed protein product [Adineta ricciae]